MTDPHILLGQELEHVLWYYRQPFADFVWSRYENAEEAITDMTRIIAALRNGDEAVLKEIQLLFGPTGSIQEISISSGWGNEYIEISARVDRCLELLWG